MRDSRLGPRLWLLVASLALLASLFVGAGLARAAPSKAPAAQAASARAMAGQSGSVSSAAGTTTAAVPAALVPDQLSNDACLACHATPGMTKELPNGDVLFLSIDQATYDGSVHGKMGYACVQCHTDIDRFPHDPITANSRREFAFQRYLASCIQCHPDKYEATLHSVHQMAIAAGNTNAAVCTDCHGAHDVAPPREPRSRESQMCQRCHSEVFDLYRNSVHGEALVGEGNADVPSCTDCHGVHDLEGPDYLGDFHLRSPEICAKCHNDPELMSRYGLNADVYDTYVGDFHGTTVELFQAVTPDQPTNKPVCVDCHGVHDILRHEDPRSHVIKENLLATCQRCHPDATTGFPDSWLRHYRPDMAKSPLVYMVELFYKILIPVVIGGMVLFNATDIRRRLINRSRRGK